MSAGGLAVSGARRGMRLMVAAGAVAAVGSCGSSQSAHSAAHGPRSTAAAPSTSTATSPQRLTVTPATGLHDKQAVQVSGVGFTPGEQLTVVQCADKGTNTGPGDCNLSAMTPIAADAKGTGTATLTVVAGPFGGNKIDCRKQRCLISMTQATPSPTEEADSPISFAAN